QARLNAALAAQQDARAAAGRSSGRRSFPAIASARARRSEALLNLRRTVVRAPVSGTISQVERLQPGQVAAPGSTVVTIVANDETWIEANFKETDLDRMRIGQQARITFDAYPNLALAGRVESIGAGTGSEFSILPSQNATGNWVKVTQRVPVRIRIEGTPSRPMIAGLSANVRVTVEDDED
ncbi:MAG: HlyD family secretion protein, partial [Sphingomonadaceae bacterium]|nr:HlyD family secretion protein [Sphingomonadaceae bacterium]